MVVALFQLNLEQQQHHRQRQRQRQQQRSLKKKKLCIILWIIGILIFLTISYNLLVFLSIPDDDDASSTSNNNTNNNNVSKKKYTLIDSSFHLGNVQNHHSNITESSLMTTTTTTTTTTSSLSSSSSSIRTVNKNKKNITVYSNNNNNQETQKEEEDDNNNNNNNLFFLKQNPYYYDSISNVTKKKTGIITLDIVTISSLNRDRLELVQAQHDYLMSYKYVRNLFNITELHDIDKQCNTDLNLNDVLNIKNYCKNKNLKTNKLTNEFVNHYTRSGYLLNMTNPIGWLCAIPRPLLGLYHVIQYYNNHKKKKNYHHHYNNVDEDVLPDYLLLIDDDTYINIDMLIRQINDNFPNNNHHQQLNQQQNQPLVIAGCVVRWTESIYTFGWGGYGTFFNKLSLEKMTIPISCSNTTTSSSSSSSSSSNKKKMIDAEDKEEIKNICNQIYKQNLIGEAFSFKDGMSIIDMMYEYVRINPYTKYKQWSNSNSNSNNPPPHPPPRENTTTIIGNGMCLHGDWLVSYIPNMYNMSSSLSSTTIKQDHYFDRIHPIQKNSELYKRPTGLCLNDGDKPCRGNGMICHHVSIKLFHNQLNSRLKRQQLGLI